jgi:hypothetical protein
MELEPLSKVTVPVGAPQLAGVTVQVKSTVWPPVEGLGESASTEVVLITPAGLTTCETALLVLPP